MPLVASKNIIKIPSLSLLSSIVFVLASFTMQNVFAQSSQEIWELFKDPENEFSIKYPSFINHTSWKLAPAENRFEMADLSIAHSNGPQDGLVQIQYNIMPEEINQIIKESNYDQTDVEDNFDVAFRPLITSLFGGLDLFHQIEDTDYNKYKIDGHRAASTIFSFKQSGLDLAGWMVATIIGNKLFIFNYIAGQNQFDTNFPIAERMLDSIKILDK